MALPQDNYAPYTGIDGSTSFTPINDQAEPDTPNDLTDFHSNAASLENTESSDFDKFIPGWKGNGKGVTANESKPDTSSSKNFENSTLDNTSNNGEYDKYTHGWEVKSKEVTKEPSDTEQKQGNLQKQVFKQNQKNDSKKPASPKSQTGSKEPVPQKSETDNKPPTQDKPAGGRPANSQFNKNKDVNKNNDDKTDKASDVQSKDKKKAIRT